MRRWLARLILVGGLLGAGLRPESGGVGFGRAWAAGAQSHEHERLDDDAPRDMAASLSGGRTDPLPRSSTSPERTLPTPLPDTFGLACTRFDDALDPLLRPSLTTPQSTARAPPASTRRRENTDR